MCIGGSRRSEQHLLIRGLVIPGPFLLVRPAGRTHLEVTCLPTGRKSSTGPTGGTVSRTARVSTVRWNLKEAAGKALGRIDNRIRGGHAG